MDPNPIQENNNQPVQPTPPIMPGQKNKIPSWLGFVAIVIGIVILFGGVFAYQYFSVEPAPVVVQTPQVQSPTAGWKTYTNSQYGFEIKYPQDWTIPESRYGSDTKILTDIVSSPVRHDLVGYESVGAYYLVNLNFDTDNRLLTNSQGFFVVPQEMLGATMDEKPIKLSSSSLSKYPEYGIAQQIISTFKFIK